MMKNLTKIKLLVFYPFFLALYPLLALLEFNSSEVNIQVIWRLSDRVFSLKVIQDNRMGQPLLREDNQ